MGVIKSCREVRSLRGLHLYQDGTSPCCQKVRLVLEHKHLQWTPHTVDLWEGENFSEWFFQVNPRGMVPVLIHDGKTVVESEDIMLYLEKHFPDQPLLPPTEAGCDEVQQLLQLCADTQESVRCLSLEFVYGTLARRSQAQLDRLSRYTTDRRSYELLMSHKDGFTQRAVQQEITKLKSVFQSLENKLSGGRDWLCGDMVSLADYAWISNVHLARLCNFPMGDWPRLVSWYNTLSQLTVFHTAVVQHEPAWMNIIKVKVGMFDLLGKGVQGCAEGIETMWHVPAVCGLLLLITLLFCPSQGLHIGFTMSYSLLVSSLLCVTFGSIFMAYLQVQQPQSQPTAPPVGHQELFMKAAVLIDYTGPEVLKITLRQKQPRITNQNEVKVKVKAASVNPIDLRMRIGYGHHMFNHQRRKNRLPGGHGQEFPLTLGRDFSGVVTEVGAKVTKVKVGDEVVGAPAIYAQGTLAEYVVLRDDYVHQKPADTSHEEAAALVYVGLTVWSALVSVCGLSAENAPGKRVLINAGTGGVGTFAIQLVKTWGCHVTTTCSTDGIELLRELGADDVIDYKKQSVKDTLKHLEKFDVVLNLLPGQQVIDDLLKSVKHGGFLVTLLSTLPVMTSSYGYCLGSVLSAVSWLKTWLPQKLFHGRNFYWSFYSPNSQALETIVQLVNQEKIKPVVEKIFTFQEVHRAFDHVDKGHSRGKTVVKVQ